jgi:hypothetical protein
MRSRPFITEVRQFFLPRIFVATAAMLVVCADGGVLVPRYANDAGIFDSLDHFVRPRRVADQIPETRNHVDITATRDFFQHCFERRKICVDVGDQRVTHALRRARDALQRRTRGTLT